MIAVARTVSSSRLSLSFSTPRRRSEAMTPRSASSTAGSKRSPRMRSASICIIFSRAALGNQSV